jgi:hypothetical protein
MILETRIAPKAETRCHGVNRIELIDVQISSGTILAHLDAKPCRSVSTSSLVRSSAVTFMRTKTSFVC